MPQPNIVICSDREALNRKTAQLLVQLTGQAIVTNRRATLALSGGSTPKSLYELLATAEWRERIEWANLHLFLGDERYVPPDHPDSNFGMASKAMISKVPIPPQNVHRVLTELPSPEEAATNYERVLREAFATNKTPQFDFILLGLGENGHTASLFPHTTVLKDNAHIFASVWVEEVKAYRLTLTAQVINFAKNIVFMISGASKAGVLKAILHGPYEPERLPAQLIKPVSGSLLWIVDQAAAAELPKQ